MEGATNKRCSRKKDKAARDHRVLRLCVGKNAQQDDVVSLLESLLERAKRGEILQACVVYDTPRGWGSVGSLSLDKRVTSAMLIELGVRGLLEGS
jgi:hypothetical protein